MKGKPIEPGCLAIVVGSPIPQNNGRVVRVLQRLEPGVPDRYTGCKWFGFDHPLCWLCEGVNGPLHTKYEADAETFKDSHHAIEQPYLRRIDDGDTTEPRVTETHKPKTEQVF